MRPRPRPLNRLQPSFLTAAAGNLGDELCRELNHGNVPLPPRLGVRASPRTSSHSEQLTPESFCKNAGSRRVVLRNWSSTEFTGQPEERSPVALRSDGSVRSEVGRVPKQGLRVDR